MTEPKPLSDGQLREITKEVEDGAAIGNWRSGQLLATIRERDATIRRRGELIRYLYRNMSAGNRQAIDFAGANHTDDLAPEILAIVEAGDE